jgi:hypothetical protein
MDIVIKNRVRTDSASHSDGRGRGPGELKTGEGWTRGVSLVKVCGAERNRTRDVRRVQGLNGCRAG